MLTDKNKGGKSVAIAEGIVKKPKIVIRAH